MQSMGEMDARIDASEREATSTLKRLADRLPACTQELLASEVLCKDVTAHFSALYRPVAPMCPMWIHGMRTSVHSWLIADLVSHSTVPGNGRNVLHCRQCIAEW